MGNQYSFWEARGARGEEYAAHITLGIQTQSLQGGETHPTGPLPHGGQTDTPWTAAIDDDMLEMENGLIDWLFDHWYVIDCLIIWVILLFISLVTKSLFTIEITYN